MVATTLGACMASQPPLGAHWHRADSQAQIPGEVAAALTECERAAAPMRDQRSALTTCMRHRGFVYLEGV